VTHANSEKNTQKGPFSGVFALFFTKKKTLLFLGTAPPPSQHKACLAIRTPTSVRHTPARGFVLGLRGIAEQRKERSVSNSAHAHSAAATAIPAAKKHMRTDHSIPISSFFFLASLNAALQSCATFQANLISPPTHYKHHCASLFSTIPKGPQSPQTPSTLCNAHFLLHHATFINTYLLQTLQSSYQQAYFRKSSTSLPLQHTNTSNSMLKQHNNASIRFNSTPITKSLKII